MEIAANIRDKCLSDYMFVMDSIFSAHKNNFSKSILSNNFSEIKKSVYLVFPFYFANNFKNIKETDVYALSLCGNLYHTYLMMIDNFIDNKLDNVSIIPLQKLHETAILKIVDLFPPKSLFWVYFHLYRERYALGMKKEYEKTNKDNSSYSYTELEEITKAKCAFTKCSTAGLLILSGMESKNDPFIKTQDEYHIGLQILDDIQDWREDYRNNNKSYLLHQVFSDMEFIKKLNCVEDKENTLGKYIYFSEITATSLENALYHFQESKKSCLDFDVPYWTSFLENYISYCEHLILNHTKNKKTIRSHIHQEDERIFITDLNKSSACIYALNKGISYLLLERENDYLEANHDMQMPSSEIYNPDPRNTLVSGNIFQRTIIVETFLDINLVFNNSIDNNIIQEDINRIIAFRMSQVRGGWSYFPGYQFLPPDTDDLAQVIQILARSKFPKINEQVDDPINLVLSFNKNQDGTFKTWILDPSDYSDFQQKLRTATKNYWGDYAGRDIEVSANLLYSLYLYNQLNYKSVISKGVQAITSAQTKEGYWDSIWYWGPFYGTYVATRFLVETNNIFDNLKKTKIFITTHQNDDGGWGLKWSDPLNTALALLILKYLNKFEKDINPEVFNRGSSYLLKEQLKTGSWRKVPYIRMRNGEKDITYMSETITTVFVLRALTVV